MLIYHTSDWHLGRMLYGRSLLSDQEHFLYNVLLPAIERERPAALIIAGDIYDRQVASIEAIQLFDAVLDRLISLGCKVFAISGNHDGAGRMAIMKSALRRSGVYIATTMDEALTPVTLSHDGESVQLTLLPYSDPSAVRDFLSDNSLRGETACMGAILDQIRPSLDQRLPQILVAHCFAAGASVSDSESVFVGGSGQVSPGVFEGFDYVALGHLHGPQPAGENARYSGSPLKYSVSEADQRKCFLSLEISGGRIDCQEIGIPPLRDVRRIKGSFEELMSGSSEDYVELDLTDRDPVLLCAQRLRPRYPNLLCVTSSWTLKAAGERSGRLAGRDSQAVFTAFMKDVCGLDTEEADLELFREIWKEVQP